MLALTLIFISLITGCNEEENQGVTQMRTLSEPLRIMHPDEAQFMNNYGNTFRIKFPNVKFEVISSKDLAQNGYKISEVLQFISDNHPDIIVVDPFSYQRREIQSLLYPLDRLFQQNGMTLNGFIPSIIAFLNHSGKKPLYGLTPSFISQAIFWNKDLFNRYMVPYPSGLLSWEEVLDLAKQFPYREGVVGLYEWHPPEFNPFTLFVKITGTYELDFAGPEGNKRLLSEPLYASIWSRVMDAYRNGYVYNPLLQTDQQKESSSEYSTNLFLKGKAAMYIDSNYFLRYLRDASKNGLPEVNWETAAMPVNPYDPKISNSYIINEIYAINATSNNLESAWSLLQHIHSDEIARVLSRYDDSFGISTRIAFAKDYLGRELSSFYQLIPSFQEKQPYAINMEKVPEYRKTLLDTSLRALDGMISTSEALVQIGKAIEALYSNK